MLKTLFLATLTLGAMLASAQITMAAEAEAGNADPTPAYRAYVAESLRWRDNQSLEPARIQRVVQSGNIHHIAMVGASEVRLWQETGQAEYARQAVQRIAGIVKAWKALGSVTPKDYFFAVYPLMFAYSELLEGGYIDAALAADFRRYVQQTYKPMERGDHNRAMSAAAGLALAAQVFPDVPEAQAWRKYAEDVWNDWYALRDTTENSANYNGIFLTYMFALADVEGKTDALLDPRVHAMFERFRDQVSPMGAIADYGDSGMYASWESWVSAFERAAALYQDPTLRWAAQRMFAAGSQHAPSNSQAAWFLALADLWHTAGLPAKEPQVGSAVLVRPEPGNAQALDKLVLAQSRQPGTPFLLAELYARGSHAHPAWGSVAYLEVDNTPLLWGLGYHNRAPSHANLVLMRPAGEEFPLKSTPYVPGVWHEAVLPTAALPPVSQDPARADRRAFTGLTFRVRSEKGPVELIVDNLRLVGPAGELVLDDFETMSDWRGGLRRELVDDAVQGQKAMKVWIGKDVITFISRGFVKSFSTADYSEFRFSWKLSNRNPQAQPLIFRVDALDESLTKQQFDYHATVEQLLADVRNARVSAQDGDSYGVIELAQWFTHDTTLRRQLVLTREGILVVRDDLAPGMTADGYAAGPIWHLHSLVAKGTNWFDSGGDDKRLLVYFGQADGRTFGVQYVSLWGGNDPFTVYARQLQEAARPVEFTTVMVPHDPAVTGAELASRLHVTTTPAGATVVRVGLADHEVTVEIGSDGEWRVARTGF